MTDYKTIFGKKIKFLTSDLSAAEGEGEIFYSNTDSKFKTAVASAAWSAGSNVNTARSYGGSAGTMTANVFFGGEIYPNPNASTEEYNGSGWSTSNNMNVGRGSIGGFGIQTAAVAVAGTHPAPSDIVANVEEYDGSSWTAGNNYPASVTNSNGSGTLTAGIQMGGHTATANQDASNEYDGTNWTSGGDMNSARNALMAATQGTQTATLAAGGGTANCETYDGSSWTEVGNLPVSCGNNKGGGTQTNAVSYGGEPPGGVPAGVEAYTWDGTSWTASANMTKHRIQLGGSGTATAALAISGVQPGLISDTEEFNITAMTVTAAAWASGGNLNTARRAAGTFGTQTAAVCAAGSTSDPGITTTLNSESYDGSSWTEGGNLNTGGYGRGCFGVQTAGVFTGGYAGPPGVNITATETYDGSSYSTSPATLNTGRSNTGHCGISTAGLLFAGPPDADATEEWNGSAWSNGEDLATGRNAAASFGTQTAAVCAGGRAPPPAATKNTEHYDGTDWTSGAAMSDNHEHTNGGSGLQTDGLVSGNMPASATTEGYDGTSWSTRPSMGTAVMQHSTATQGTSTAALVSGGGNPPGVRSTTQEFTGDTGALNLKTITDS